LSPNCLDLHVAEQGNVGLLIAAQPVVGLQYGVLAPLLSAAHDLDERGLEDPLDQGRQGADAGPEDEKKRCQEPFLA
jgi:hypothetical protein